MGHVPHVFVPGDWMAERITLASSARHHLSKVLRLRDGDPVSYTNGAGTIGTGTYADGDLRRGDEQAVSAPSPELVLAVAPPQSAERTRFLVEKAAELEVTELRWLSSRHRGSRTPRRDKAEAWSTSALEQSRGAWRMRIGDDLDLAHISDAGTALALIAQPGGRPLHEVVGSDAGASVAIAIGPEGGFASDELPDGVPLVALGRRVLRVETAAIVAAGALRCR